MRRTQHIVTCLSLILASVIPTATFGYINAGFRSQAAYDRYLQEKRLKRRSEEIHQKLDEERRRQAEEVWRVYLANLATLDAAVQRDPNDAVALYQRGKFSQDRNDPDRAMGDFNAAIERDRKLARAYFRRSALWFANRDYASALADLDETLRLEPTYIPAHFHRAAFFVACPDMKRRDLNEAQNSAEAAYNLAKSAWEAGDAAGPELQRLTILHECCRLLAVIQAEGRNFESAIKWEANPATIPVSSDTRRITLYRRQQTDQLAQPQLAFWISMPSVCPIAGKMQR